MIHNNIKRVAVLKGGWSPEREISLRSGAKVADSFRKLGYETCEIDVIKDLRFVTDELYRANPDYIYNALHGIGGEDGVIQGVLEIFGKPYSNSKVLGSVLSFNKVVAKILACAHGVLVPRGVAISKNNLQEIDVKNPPVGYPFIIKPAENGSSVGVFLVSNESDMLKILETEWTFGDEIIIEEYIDGREFTVLVINDGKAVGSVEIISKNAFYDYASKYDSDGSKHVAKYEMNSFHRDNMHRMAELAYRACKCSGVARADFIYNGKDSYFIEINTQPGMTDVSLVPDIARSKGMSFEDILKIDL